MNKILKRILIGLGSALLLFALSIVVVLNYFEDEVVEFAKEKAKNYFVTEVNFGQTELTFWKTFPSASLHVKDVFIRETFEEKDTLIFANSVFLEFGLTDLFRGKYNVHSIRADESIGKFKTNEKGEDNWHFWKESEEENGNFKLELKRISLNDVHFLFDHKKNGFFMELSSGSAVGKGEFSSSKFELSVDIDGKLHRLENEGEAYAIEKIFSLKGAMDADTEKSIFTFQKSKLAIEKMPFLISGTVDASDKSAVDLVISGDGLSVKDLLASLTPEQQARFKDYAASGKLNAEIKIKGDTYDKNVPVTDIHFTVKSGALRHKPSDVKLEELSCDLRYTSGAKEDLLSIRHIKTKTPTGYVDLQGIIKNLKKPELDISLNAETELDNLRRFFAWDTLEVCSGRISTEAHITGVLQYIEADSSYNWKALNTTGKAKLQGAKLQLRNSNRIFTAMNSDIVFDNKDVNIQNFSGEINGSDFTINGRVKNLVPFLTTNDERLLLEAKLSSEKLDFTNLVETASSVSHDYYFELPERIDFILNSAIQKFTFRSFEAEDIRGTLRLDRMKLTIDPLDFRTANGDFNARLSLTEGPDENYIVNCLATLKGIQIQKLFYGFENFGQEFITDKNLRGVTTADVQFKTTMTKTLHILPEKVESLIDIAIDNGELIGLESLQEIAAYLKKNKLAAPFVDTDKLAEKLRDINFSRLENVIEIKNSNITIPSMDIRSSAMDISARGNHGFDKKINYTIGFSLRDILVRKQRDYEVEDDGLGKRLFVFMKGSTDSPEFGIDKEVAKEVRQQERQAEKDNMKALLKEEFGLFKKNKDLGTYKQEPAPQPSTTTRIEWDEEDRPQKDTPKQEAKPAPKPQPQPEPKQEEQPKKKTPKWLQEK